MNDEIVRIRSRAAADAKEADLLFFFACRLAWLREQDQEALDILLAAEQASDPQTNALARWLLHEINPPVEPTNGRSLAR